MFSNPQFICEVENFIKSTICDDNAKQAIQTVIEQHQKRVKADGEKLRQIIINKQPIPDELLYKGCIAYYPGHDCVCNIDKERWYNNLQMFIKYRPGEAIPEKMYYDDYQKYVSNDSPILLWIMYRKGEPIPHQLYYAPNDKQYQNQHSRDNLIFTWIVCRPTEMLPKRLSYPGWLRRLIYLLQYTVCIEQYYYSDMEMDEQIRKSFIENYIVPAMNKYTEIIGVDEIRDSEYKCKYCHEQDGWYKVMLRLNRPNDKRDDSVSYCLTHFTNAYKTLQDLTKNVLNIDYSAIEQLIDYAE